MIANILLHDTYRPIVFGLISVLLTYCVRNEKIGKQIISYSVYIMFIITVCAGFFFFVSLYHKSPDMKVLSWETKWICFFLVITILQHFTYKIFGEEKDIGLLVLNTAVVLALCFIASKYII